MDIKNDVALVVVSCDAYKDAWQTFVDCFKKYWPNCSLKKYVITNNKPFVSPDYTTIMTGEEISWSRKVRAAMQKIKETYLLLVLEDYFLSKRINEEEINEIVSFVSNNDIDYFRLKPYKYMKGINKRFAYISNKNIYGKNLQPAIWKKECITKCLFSDDFSAWEFESRQKNKSASKVVGIDCCSKKTIFKYENGILQGKWYGPAIKNIRKKVISINTNSRGFVPKKIIIKRAFFLFVYKIIPSWLILKLRKIFEKRGMKFVTKD